MNESSLNVASDFPSLARQIHDYPLCYLDTAATALKPACVIDALAAYYAHEPANVHRGVHALSEAATAHYEHARETVRAFINADSVDQIVFTSGATEAINLVATGLSGAGFGPDDEILISEMEHHANIVPWQMLRDRCGVRLVVIPMDDQGDLDMDAFAQRLSSRTRLVAVTALSNALGTVTPVAQICQQSRDAGAMVLVDAAQAIAQQPLDVAALDCDFLVFSGHKIFGPTGTGVLYGRRASLERLTPAKGGGDMILSVTFEHTDYADLPHRLEAGTPNIAGVIGLGRALEYVTSLGFEAIMAHETALLAYAVARLQQLDGLRIIGMPRHRRGVVSFTLGEIHPHDLGTILDHRGIAIRAGHHCAQPVMAHFRIAATARASFSIYNTQADVDRLVDGLTYAQELFA